MKNKKIVSLILSIVLMLSVVPFNAFAEEVAVVEDLSENLTENIVSEEEFSNTLSRLNVNGIVVYNYEELKNALADDTYGVIGIGDDIQLTDTLTIDRSVSFVPYEKESITLTAASGSRHFITSGDSVVYLSGITLDGNAQGGGIENTGTLTLIGGTITGCSAVHGGGIYNTGTLTIASGEITGNTATKYGGGIYNSGTLTITGGEISKNSAIIGGGIDNYGTLTIKDGVISENVVTQYGGGIDTESEVIIEGGTISGNTGKFGGGICIYYGKATITGGEIVGNTATWMGGGIHLGEAVLTISGGAIHENSCERVGGGICSNADGILTQIVDTVYNNYPENVYIG